MPIPKDAIVVNEWGRSLVYYIAEDGYIYYVYGPESSEKQADAEGVRYGKPVRVDFDDNGTKKPAEGNTQEPKVAAFNYERKNDDGSSAWRETRLYYIDNIGEIVELQWESVGEPESGGRWYKGELTGRRYQAAKGSLLTAYEDGKEIKVFFQEQDSSALSVAWNIRDDKNKRWNKRIITNAF